MRRVLPKGLGVELTDAYAGLSLPARPWLALGMVTSLDGAISVEGRSRALGGDGDQAAFRAVRALGDIVLVGAATVVTESYGATWPIRHASRRAANGQQPLPTLVIVSGSGALPADARVFHGERRPLLLTTPTGARAAATAGLGAELLVVPEVAGGGADLAAGLDQLRARFGPRVVCEGGPTLNAALVSAGLVDELFVTVAPQLVGQDGAGFVGSLPSKMPPVELTLHELRVHGSELLCRYRVQGRRYGLSAAEQG